MSPPNFDGQTQAGFLHANCTPQAEFIYVSKINPLIPKTPRTAKQVGLLTVSFPASSGLHRRSLHLAGTHFCVLAVPSVGPVRFLVLLFPPTEFCASFIAKHYSKLGGSKYSSSHFTIKGTENNRESFWPKAHMSQQPQCCPPKPHLLNYASRH